MFGAKLYFIAKKIVLSVVYLLSFIVQQGLFQLRLHHQTSVNDTRAEMHQFFTLLQDFLNCLFSAFIHDRT